MFENCSSLKNLPAGFTNLETPKVTNMSSMFSGCSGLTTLDLRSLDLSNVLWMHDMFNGCSGLLNLSFIGQDTSNVQNMSGMFQGCTGLKFLDLTDMDTHNVMSMFDMFNNCSALTSLDLSGFDTGKAYYTGYMFNCCSKLKTIYVGNGGYLTYKSASVKELNDDFDATSIDDIKSTTTGDVYTLQGIYVGKNIDLNTLPKGIYVVGGKKIMVK